MYALEIEQRITKELLLSKYTQEIYMEHYLGVPVKKGLFCSPPIIRSDKQPTCAFYKNSRGILKFKDFAGPTFDFVGAVQYINNCGYPKALKIIANDFGFIKDEKLIKTPIKKTYISKPLEITERAKIQVEIQDFLEKELNWWKSFGISLPTLKKFKVYSIKNVFLNGFYHTSSSENSPIYGYFGGYDNQGNELWRLYMPNKRKYRFLSNWSATMLQGVKQLPKYGDIIVITKSMKDVMSLYEHGITAIAPNSENLIIAKNRINKMTNIYSRPFILFDNDLSGVQGAHKYKKSYNCSCIFIKRKYAKDISDLYKKSSSTQFWEIINELDQIFKDPLIKKTKHFYIF
jgi:hypothetical protein